MGVLNMQIETALEGSPIFVQKIGKAHMSWIREVEKVKKDSDWLIYSIFMLVYQ